MFRSPSTNSSVNFSLSCVNCSRSPSVTAGRDGRERVGEDVEDVDAVPAVGLDALVDDPRRDREIVARREPDRPAHAGAVAVVDVLLDATGPAGPRR